MACRHGISSSTRCMCECSYMPVHVYRLPWSLDKSASELVTCVSVHGRLWVCYACVHGASCCPGSDKRGSRGLELIKCNDAKWGDLTVCCNQEQPPHQQPEKRQRKRMTRKIVSWKYSKRAEQEERRQIHIQKFRVNNKTFWEILACLFVFCPPYSCYYSQLDSSGLHHTAEISNQLIISSTMGNLYYQQLTHNEIMSQLCQQYKAKLLLSNFSIS